MKTVGDYVNSETLTIAVIKLQRLFGVILCVEGVQGRQNDSDGKRVVQGWARGQSKYILVGGGKEDEKLIQHLSKGRGLNGDIIHAVADEVPHLLASQDLVSQIKGNQVRLGCQCGVTENGLR